MRKMTLVFLVACIAVGASTLMVPSAMAARTVNIDVNPGSSSPTNVSPDITGDVNATYSFTVFPGASLTQTIPVQVCMTGYDETATPAWNKIDVSFGSTGGNLGGVTLPSDQTYSNGATTPDCRNLQISIATGALSTTPGTTYIATFNMSEKNPDPSGTQGKPNVTYKDVKNFKIQVVVVDPPTSNVSCFLTDSEGMFLTDCSGALVTDSGSDAGRFGIVANKKGIEVATNPGQFYYNFVWYNSTATEQTVNVNFLRQGVVPQGAQAIHSAVFAGDLSTVDPTVFALANADGIPDGTDDQALGIVVPKGYSLLVTYHLEWAGKGSTVPGNCAASCGTANQFLSVTGTVSGSGITTETCTSTASGYKK